MLLEAEARLVGTFAIGGSDIRGSRSLQCCGTKSALVRKS